MVKIFCYLFCLSVLVLNVFAQQQANDSTYQQDAVLQGDIQVFQLTMVNAFPFISGEVNGVKGKFMLDTGNRNTIEINNNLVPLKGEKPLGQGNVESGQTFRVFINDSIDEVKFSNGLTYQNIVKIQSDNLNFLQGITPDCIGYVGYGFFKDYLMKLDYQRNKATFYKNTPERLTSKDFLKGEKVLAILDYEIRKLPDIPLVKIKIGTADVLATFDTGAYGAAQFDEVTQKDLLKKGVIVPSGTSGQGDDLYDFNKVSFARNLQITVPAMELEPTNRVLPYKKAAGVTETNTATFGYRFLAQFTTVWDFQNKKIYVLKR